MIDEPPSSPDSQRTPNDQQVPSSDPTQAAQSDMTQLILSRLSKGLGPARAKEIMEATLAHLGLHAIETPQELLAFSEHLISQGGMLRAVGRGLKIRAVLHGAVTST